MTYLVLRFSTIGNVAMSVPVLHSVATRYPEHQFVVVSRKLLAPMFHGYENIHFETVDLSGKHKGIKGMWHLYKELKSKYDIKKVIDLQNEYPSIWLRRIFAFSGCKTVAIDKGLKAKCELVRKGAAEARPIKSMFDFYAETFEKIGLKTDKSFVSIQEDLAANAAIEKRFGKKEGQWIGIAPFAKYASNRLPFRTTKDIIAYFSKRPGTKVFLFGAGEIESEMLQQWADVFGNVTCVAGQLQLDGELALMRKLDVMVCMDSANKHLSALIGQSAISVWGGTHPYAGFYAWNQRPDNMLQLDLPCRPCTINGTDTCKRQDFACIKGITAQQVIEKVELKLKMKTDAAK